MAAENVVSELRMAEEVDGEGAVAEADDVAELAMEIGDDAQGIAPQLRQPGDDAETRTGRALAHWEMIMVPTMTDETWRRAAVRRFSMEIAALTALFVVSEIVAALRLVPHLEPVSLHTLITNPLFAIGFGGPLVLHLTSLPRVRELAATLAAGVVLSLATGWLAGETGVMQWVIGLGLGSTLVLAVRAARREGDALLFLLPSIVTLLFTLEAAMFLNVICTCTR
jgi:hypothetical protein